MTQMILKLKEDERVCAFCELAQGLVYLTFPIALPVLIMYLATQHY